MNIQNIINIPYHTFVTYSFVKRHLSCVYALGTADPVTHGTPDISLKKLISFSLDICQKWV